MPSYSRLGRPRGAPCSPQRSSPRRREKSVRLLRFFLSGALTLAITGCSGVLPRSSESTETPWASFEAAKHAYDKVQPGQTSTEDLRDLGFDPEHGQNVRVLSYLELQQRFMPTPSISRSDLDPQVRACLDLHSACSGIEVKPQAIERRRVGNAVLDVFDFQRETVETGWTFTALVLLQDGVAVYKTWSGSANIRSTEKRTNPLGPLQDLGGFAADRATNTF